jgi:hypothetical protein
MSPRYRVLPPNGSTVWLNRTRLLPSADFAFAASKRTAKTAGISAGRKEKSKRFCTAPRDSSEAASLKTSGPYVQNAHNPGDT